jgi:two-component system nitrogen regulation sensor histidine kinase NtrY
LTEGPAEQKSHYRRNLLIVSGGLALLALAWWGFKVWIHAPQVPLASNLAVFALFNLNLIVFLLLVVLLFRNLVKLAFERRQKVLGARFKTKLVLAFLSLALTPAILIFIIASNFINTSIEGWFKPQVERPLDQALEVAQTYYQGQEAMACATRATWPTCWPARGSWPPPSAPCCPPISPGSRSGWGSPPSRCSTAPGSPCSRQGRGPRTVPTRSVNKEQLRRGLSGQEVTTVHELDDGDMIQAIVPIKSSDRALLGRSWSAPTCRSGSRRGYAASASPSRSTSSCVFSASPSRASTSCSSSS